MTARRGGEPISSPQNARVKAAAALRRRKERDATGRYLVEGRRAAVDLLESGDVVEVFATEEEAAALAEPLAAAPARLTVVTAAVIERIATARTPQGVVAVAQRRPAELADVVGAGHLVVLVGVSDPGNAGTAIRTATATGAGGVVLTAGSVDPWNPKAVRASAGAVARMPIVCGVRSEEVLAACARAGQRTVALDVAGHASATDPGVLTPPVALVFGSEAHGLPATLIDACDRSAAVPVRGPVESLNLSAAVAVVAYAAVRAAEERER